jgi:acyl-homoserine lactone synthase
MGGSAMQVHVVGQHNAGLYKAEMEDNFLNRHQVFVKKRRWHDLARQDCRDVDDFDTDQAVHFLVMNQGKVQAGFRMNGYTEPTLMKEVFAHMLERPLPGDVSDRMDCTRFYSVAKGESGDKRGQLTTLMFAAMMEYGLHEGARYITFITYAHFIDMMVSLGIKVEPLGGLQKVDRWPSMAAFMHVNEEALQGLQAALGISRPVLTARDGVLPPLGLSLPPYGANSAEVARYVRT